MRTQEASVTPADVAIVDDLAGTGERGVAFVISADDESGVREVRVPYSSDLKKERVPVEALTVSVALARET